MKKILNYSSIELVNFFYDEKLVTVMRSSFSFLGFVELTKMDSS